MPWTLIRSMLREISISLVLAVVGLTSVFVVVLMMQAVARFDVIATSTLLAMVPSLASGYQTLLLPIATLTALSLAYSRLTAGGEKTALFASGVSPRALLMPAVVIGLVLILPAHHSAFTLSPSSYLQRDRLRADALGDALRHPPAGTQEFNFPSFSLAYSDFRDGIFHDLVMIRDDPAGRDVVLCQRARIVYDDVQGELTILNGEPTIDLRLDEKGEPSKFLAQLNIIKVTQPLATYNSDKSPPPKAHGASGLLDRMAFEALPSFKEKRHFTNEYTRRMASTLAPFFFALIGALVAMALPTKNKIVPLLVGLLVAAGSYFGGLSLARPIAQATIYPPAIGVIFAQIAIFGPMALICVGLWWRVRRG